MSEEQTYCHDLKCQTPNKPTWPNAFSATLEIHRNNNPRPDFWRQFFDYTKQVDRFDGLVDFRGDRFFANIYLLHNIGRQYNVLYQFNEVLCFYHPINSTVPKPDFTNWSYGGKALVQYQVADHWYFRDQSRGEFLQYYDNADNTNPLRFDFEIRRNGTSVDEQWFFHEFDGRSQDPNLFDLPVAVKSICNSAVDNEWINLSHF